MRVTHNLNTFFREEVLSFREIIGIFPNLLPIFELEWNPNLVQKTIIKFLFLGPEIKV